MISLLSYFFDMITLMQKVSFPGTSTVLLRMKNLDLPAFRACDHRICGLFALFGLSLDLRRRGFLVFRPHMGPVRPCHSLFGHFSHLILTPNRNLEFFLAEFVPAFVRALDHICPLCSAGSALSGANSAQKSFSIFLSGISISAIMPRPRPGHSFFR